MESGMYVIRYYLGEQTYYSSHTVTYSMNEAGEDEFSWTLTGYYYPMVDEDVASTEEAATVLENFFNDYFDSTVSFAYISETYFNGMNPPYISDSRDGDFNLLLEFKLIEVTTDVDENGDFISFNAVMEITSTEFGTENIDDFKFIVRVLEDGSYFLELDL